MSPSFIASLADLHKPSARASPRPSSDAKNIVDHWLLLPVRVQVPCSDKQKSHVSSSAGKNQMNPLNYLHLTQAGVDIRGSQIAIYSRIDPKTNTSSTIIFNFQDGRWSKVIEEPILRVKEALAQGRQKESLTDPLFVHAIFLSSALRWWNNALNSFNDQLIAYVTTSLSILLAITLTMTQGRNVAC